jgi:hypothetical protein
LEGQNGQAARLNGRAPPRKPKAARSGPVDAGHGSTALKRHPKLESLRLEFRKLCKDRSGVLRSAYMEVMQVNRLDGD